MELNALQQATLTRITATIENVDPYDDDPPAPPAPDEIALLLTTATKASGENEDDDEDYESAVLRAMTTTLTESTGDQENDPDEPMLVNSGPYGDRIPLAYRFSEDAPVATPAVHYDEQRQVHVIGDRPVLEIIHSA